MSEFAIQGSPEWFAQREGKLTGSCFGSAAGQGPSSRQEQWRRHMGISVFEGNPATEWGTEHESVARMAFEDYMGIFVEQTGFHVHREHDWLGVSPDGLLDDGLGCIEIKCPFSQVVYEDIPPYYMAQMQGVMEIMDREYCEFVVWTPDVLHVRRVFRNTDYWSWLFEQLADYWTWVTTNVEPPAYKRGTKPKPPDCVRVLDPVIFNINEAVF